MSSSLLLMEPMGGSFGRFPQPAVPLGANERSASRGDYGVTMRVYVLHHGVAMGSGRGAQVVAIGGLDLPGSCGPSLARIEFDNWDFLSRCLFAENLLLGPLNADVEEALMLKPGCVIQFSSLNLSVSWRRAFSCRSLANCLFRWFDAIQNYHPLPYQMNGFGKVWPSLLVTESK
ncbi:hypothetical protein CK203_079968 [Vitis vinifera]|uniref:Uncharacterized protein n=1 Tax=Vitis vinifera TaxID=29760 RepID=A0A438E4W4_VITVI|nr:hypothetical protein CK203_079968 [Vitis vinifera]